MTHVWKNWSSAHSNQDIYSLWFIHVNNRCVKNDDLYIMDRIEKALNGWIDCI